MATRVVEGKKPYTGGKAISIDENKVISLNLRDENNLIIYDEGDDEIYVDLQLDDEITPTSAFPIGVNVGRVIVDNGWDKPGTIISAVTTSGDNIKIFYADEGTLRIDNGTGTFKQIYFKADVDALLLALRNYIDGELAKKQNGVSSDTAPSSPSEGDLWYDTTSSAMKVWDGTAWQSVGGGDVLVSDQANNIFTPGMKIWGGTEGDFNNLTPDSNTAYLLTAGGPTPAIERPDITSAVDDNKSISVTSQGEVQSICLSEDGLNLYYCDYDAHYIRRYTLSTAWDITTATDTGDYLDTGNAVSGVYISQDGTSLFTAAENMGIRRYALSTAWDVTTASLTETLSVSGNLTGMTIADNGNKLYYMNYSQQKIIEYSLPTPYTLASATGVGDTSYPVGGNIYRCCAVSPTGLKVYLSRQDSTSYIYQMNMSTASDITTATYTNQNISLNYQAEGLYISPDGTKMYVGQNDGTIRQYTLS